MANNIQEAMLNKGDNEKLITEIITEIYQLCKKKNINIPNEYMQDCIDDMLSFYEQYLSTLKSIFLDIDFYKIVSWFAVFMATRIYNFNLQKRLEKNTNWCNLISLCVWYMLDQLEREGRIVPNGYHKKIVFMVVNEIKQQQDFGIGKNGLYMLMKFASIIEVNDKPLS